MRYGPAKALKEPEEPFGDFPFPPLAIFQRLIVSIPLLHDLGRQAVVAGLLFVVLRQGHVSQGTGNSTVAVFKRVERDEIQMGDASPEEALGRLSADREVALKWIRSADEASLLSREVVAPWGGPALPLFQQLLLMIAHLAQHKGQLFYYLKLMGRDVGTSDLWGA